MNILLKASGLAVLFFSSCLLGFLQSEKLKKRVKRLSLLVRATSEYAERVRGGTEEIDRLLPLCFGNGLIAPTNNGFSAVPAYLRKEDIGLVNQLLFDIGMQGGESEYERAKLYAGLLSRQLEEAEKDAAERCRLFRTLGILAGIFLCIFLL